MKLRWYCNLIGCGALSVLISTATSQAPAEGLHASSLPQLAGDHGISPSSTPAPRDDRDELDVC